MKKRKGFTLLELIVVLAIFTLVVAIIVIATVIVMLALG